MGAWYLTEYRANWVPIGKDEEIAPPGAYGAHVYASSLKEAKKLCRLRGLGERIVFERGTKAAPYRRASDLLKARTVSGRRKSEKTVLHGLSFLGMLALASGVATIQEILGDEGFIHNFCHGHTRAIVLAKVLEIEKRVPGYWPK